MNFGGDRDEVPPQAKIAVVDDQGIEPNADTQSVGVCDVESYPVRRAAPANWLNSADLGRRSGGVSGHVGKPPGSRLALFDDPAPANLGRVNPRKALFTPRRST